MQLIKLTLFVLASFINNSLISQTAIITHPKKIYKECNLNSSLDYNIFKKAIIGYNKITNKKKTNLLTIIDFTKASTQKRLFLIDLENRKVIKNTLVAHGRNSGENYAKLFSNKSKSLKSSLGFYLTGETYIGKHGYSLKLDGLEKNINNNARLRSVVIHGANYVSLSFAKKHGRIGRSWGCPALPLKETKEIINLIKNKSVIFIYANDKDYLKNSIF